jgi:hypothetical protein
MAVVWVIKEDERYLGVWGDVESLVILTVAAICSYVRIKNGRTSGALRSAAFVRIY